MTYVSASGATSTATPLISNFVIISFFKSESGVKVKVTFSPGSMKYLSGVIFPPLTSKLLIITA